MNKHLASIAFIVLVFVVPSFALRLSGNPVEITTNPSASPQTYNASGFDVKGNLVAWIDYRDDAYGIYASFLNDPSHTEYLIDANASYAYSILIDGNNIAYYVGNQNISAIRIADITNIAHPLIKDLNCAPDYIINFKISNGIVASYSRDLLYNDSIYAYSISDPSLTKHLIKQLDSYDQSRAFDMTDRKIISFGSFFDESSNLTQPCLDIIDITDLNNPVIQKNIIPENFIGPYPSRFVSLYTSGNWLIGNKTNNSSVYVSGIHNYLNPQNWSACDIRNIQGSDYGIFSLSFDSPFAVWVENIPSARQQIGISESRIWGVMFLDNGKAVVSLLKESLDPNYIFDSAVVSGDKVVYSVIHYRYEPQTVTVLSTDLFAQSLQLDCGDKGYSLADFNHDCKVDFADFAAFAERWSTCTSPDNDNCTLGEVFINPGL